MNFLVLTDRGLDTSPVVAADYPSAVAAVKDRYGQGDGTISIAILLPQVVGTVTQAADSNQATFAQSGDAAVQASIFSKAQTALATNATYLGLGSPSNAQVAAQVKALTQQMDGVIRLLIANFSATT